MEQVHPEVQVWLKSKNFYLGILIPNLFASCDVLDRNQMYLCDSEFILFPSNRVTWRFRFNFTLGDPWPWCLCLLQLHPSLQIVWTMVQQCIRLDLSLGIHNPQWAPSCLCVFQQLHRRSWLYRQIFVGLGWSSRGIFWLPNRKELHKIRIFVFATSWLVYQSL